MGAHKGEEVLELVSDRTTTATLAVGNPTEVVFQVGRPLAERPPVRQGLDRDAEESSSLDGRKSALIIKRGRRCYSGSERHGKSPFTRRERACHRRKPDGNPCSAPHGRDCYPGGRGLKLSAPSIPSRMTWGSRDPQTHNLTAPQAHPLTSEISRRANPTRDRPEDLLRAYQVYKTPVKTLLNQGNRQCRLRA